MSSRKKGVSSKQVDRIRELSREGYSTNQIQSILSREGLGLRRTIMLTYVREYRNRPAQANVSKYTPKKYVRKIYVAPLKRISIISNVNGKKRTVNVIGKGKDLMKVVLKVRGYKDHEGRPPKKQFLTISAEALLNDPQDYLEMKGKWDAKPYVNS